MKELLWRCVDAASDISEIAAGECGRFWQIVGVSGRWLDPPLTIVLLPLIDQLELKARQTKHDLGQSIDHLDLVALSTFQEKIVL